MYFKNRAGLPLESTLMWGLETSDSSRTLTDEEMRGGDFLTARGTLTDRRLQLLLLSDHPLLQTTPPPSCTIQEPDLLMHLCA